MAAILEVERDYDALTLVTTDKSVTFQFDSKTETIYIITAKDYEDAKQDVQNFKRCRILKNVPEHDVTECITFEYFSTRVDACKSLNPNYTSNDEKHKYQCIVPVKHRIRVGNITNHKQFISIMPEQRLFEAAAEDFESLKRSELDCLKSLQIGHDDTGDTKVFSLADCVNPPVIVHPGFLAEIPNTWTDDAQIGSALEQREGAIIKSRVANEAAERREANERREARERHEATIAAIAAERRAAIEQHEATKLRFAENTFVQRQRPKSLRSSSRREQPALRVANDDTPPDDEANTEDAAITIQNSSTLISQNYNFEHSLHSMTLDIISVYLKGQKMLYIEAKVYCEQHLYALMLPAIVITAICSVVSLALNNYPFGGIIVSCFTACNSCILSLVTYLKLDAKAEAHKMTAYSFEKLQSMCEFSSGRILFDDKELTLLKLMEEIGNNVKDIKEKNQFILPEAIRYRFPYLYSTNVFAEVKQIQNSELILTNDMQNLIEAGKQLKRDIDEGKTSDIPKYEKILKDQKYSFEKLMNYREHYMEIDSRFKREIDRNIRLTENSRCNCCQWLKN
jgi:hypothetical protein